jgi:hypothetical protein
MLDGEDTNGAFSDGNTIQHSRRIPLSMVTKALRRHVTDQAAVWFPDAHVETRPIAGRCSLGGATGGLAGLSDRRLASCHSASP